MAQIKTWLITQFAQLRFNHLNGTEQLEIDLLPFFTPNLTLRHTRSCLDHSKSVTEHISNDLYSALEICRSSPSGRESDQLLRRTKFNMGRRVYYSVTRAGLRFLATRHTPPQNLNRFVFSSQTIVLCRLMPRLLSLYSDIHRQWFELLGEPLMTSERYGMALQRTAYYLLQLPKDIVAKLLSDPNSKKDIIATPIMRLICRVLPTFLHSSPPTTDLYFLVMLTGPVMRSLGIDNKIQRRGGRDAYISDYTQKVSLLLAVLAYVRKLLLCALFVLILTVIRFLCLNVNRRSRTFRSCETQPAQTTSKFGRSLKRLGSMMTSERIFFKWCRRW